jgi:predicted cupin superfamily sugar epimerase
MYSPTYWIDHLQLLPHPEGGFYKETYRSSENIPSVAIPTRFEGERSFSTAIYFLLRSQDKSMFHKIKSDELWHFHAGSSLTIYVLNESGLTLHKLGLDVAQGESPQVIIPAMCWFGATVNKPNRYTLASCTVAPGFHFVDFQLANRSLLLNEFPAHTELIKQLTL